MVLRVIKWIGVIVLALPVLAIVLLMIFGLNWARVPLQRITLEKTGRALVIGGDLSVRPGWPAPHLRAESVTFANPAWAREKQMIAVDKVEFTVDLLQLLKMKLSFPEVNLGHPVVFLEQAVDGRKTWLLDTAQSDESARIPIGRLMLDHGRIGYDDVNSKTSIRAELSTHDTQRNVSVDGVTFSATGFYKGLALLANGSGGSVLALHDESVAYPLQVDATIGRTTIKANGAITSLIKFSAMDLQLALSGDSLAMLFPLLGVALPETHPYAMNGHLLHSGQVWHYEKFSGHIGKSDVAGSAKLDRGGARPFLRGDLMSKLLDVDDLGPLIGAKKKRVAVVPVVVASHHVLPDIPFKTERWDSVDADVTLHAESILRAHELPLEDLQLRLNLQNSLLTLDPIDFGFAGGHLKAVIALDGRHDPIRAHANIRARKIQLSKLFPAVVLTRASIGQINGEFDLSGSGDSVGDMLATADGRVGLVIENGEISRLLMQEIGLHLLEILQLKISGDEAIKLRCGVANFTVKRGVMTANALVLDTDVSTIEGSGSINLRQETLDLTLLPKTRATSPVALRSPIYVKGTFSKPDVSIDKGRIALRSGGAIGLGLLNPLLMLIPLVEPGPGVDSECARLIQQARSSSNDGSSAPAVTRAQ